MKRARGDDGMRRMLVAASTAVVFVAGGSGVAAGSERPASKAPVVARLKATPGRLSHAGGRVRVSARVVRARECKLDVTPLWSKPVAFACGAGVWATTVSFPANRTRKVDRYTVTWVAAGRHGRTVDRTHVVVAGMPAAKSTPPTSAVTVPTTDPPVTSPPTSPPTVPVTSPPTSPPVTTPPTAPPVTGPPATVPPTVPVEPTVTEFAFTTDDPSPSGIGINGGDGTFTIDTDNPYSNTGCSFVEYLGAPAALVSGIIGSIPCNQQIMTVLNFPAGDNGGDFGFTVYSGPDSQGQAGMSRSFTITET